MHHYLVGPALFTQRYFMLRPETESQARECGTGTINLTSDLFGFQAVCDEHRAELFDIVNILQGLTIKQIGLELLTSD